MYLTTFTCFLTSAFLVSHIQANGIPSEEALNAKTFDEFIAKQEKPLKERLRADHHMEVSSHILADSFEGVPGFYHGVASGSPTPNRVIVWTRYTPETLGSHALVLRMAKVDTELEFEDHLDPEKNSDLRTVTINVTPESDFIAKVDVTGLESNTHYVYAFVAEDNYSISDIGQTRTAPGPDEDVEELTYAFFSCSHFANGYFHAYDVASTIKDLDFWIHVGDYIYEYGEYSSYASDAPERKSMIEPKWEIVDLQDYRNRYATYHLDKGLQNLRRRAPMIATWDDHETTNNSYGEGDLSNTGAENHQEICPVNRTSTNAEKASANCDRDEGSVKTRFTNAAQAYMEWLPLRTGTVPMGVVELTSITQVVEWGKLATFVSLDSRITARSGTPALASAFDSFAGYAFQKSNWTSYYDPSSEERQVFEYLAMQQELDMWNPEYTMIGDINRKFMKDVFSKSKMEGKVWQTLAVGTMMGPHVPLNIDDFVQFVEPAVAPYVKGYTDAVLSSSSGYFMRAMLAMAETGTPWNLDGWDGYATERAEVIGELSQNTNNPIVLGGDLHDSWAWTLYERGEQQGVPQAVNLGCPGVTSPGWGGFLAGIVSPIADLVGGMEGAFKLVSNAFIKANHGLKYADVQKKGFVAIKMTKTTHTAEYILIDPEYDLVDFDKSSSTNGGLTAGFTCDVSLVTLAGLPGSLEKQDECIIEFETEQRPAIWDLPVPNLEAIPGIHLNDCGYNACKFSPEVSEEMVVFATHEGCLTSEGLTSKRGIKTKPCNGFKSQKWNVDKHGKISSTVDPSWCFAQDGQRLVIDKCDNENIVMFGYDKFEAIMYLKDDPDIVVSTGYDRHERIKLVSRQNMDNEVLTIVIE